MKYFSRLPWIVEGLKQFVPSIPFKSNRRRQSIYSYDDESDEDEDGYSNGGGANNWNGNDILEDPDRGKGYKEWLEESAQLHQDAANLAQELLTSRYGHSQVFYLYSFL